mgnify:CR=1 FL=1
MRKRIGKSFSRSNESEGDMRAVKAKRMRKKVYGDFSQRERKYYRETGGVIRGMGRRAEYQELKRR